MLNPMLLKTAAMNQHSESLELVADQLLNNWQPKHPNKKESILNLERDLYCYLVQVCKYLFRKIPD